MGVISRGIKNAFRNTVRTASITFILALSIAMSLIMLLALKTVQSKIDSVKSSIGNTITVSPAGVRGFEGGGELLTEQDSTDITNLPNIVSITKVLSDRLRKEGTTEQQRPGETTTTTATNNTTSLDSSVEPGSFGNRQRASQNGTTQTETFTMPITLTGVSDIDSAAALSALGASQFDVTSGTKIDASSSDNIAMIGSDLAIKNNLTAGQTFRAYGADITISGIYDAGSTFANATIIMPIQTVENLSGQSGQINSIIVQTDSIDSVASVQSAIKDKLGGDKVDVTSQQDTSDEAIKPLENIKTISFYSLIGSLMAGSIIIFLTMIMIVRERRREIGVLKAIGSSNVGIVAQFIAESLSLTFLSGVVGIILGIFFSNPILKVLVSNSESTGSGAGPSGFVQGGGMMARFGGGVDSARNVLNNIHAVVGWEIILYGLVAAIIIAILGSAIPAFFIAKVRPAEVMRAE